VFDLAEPEIEACVSNETVTLLARISTELPVDPMIGADDETWRKADESQALIDAQFIAHARADVPALVAEVRRLKGMITALNEKAQDAGEEASFNDFGGSR
jgi:hypothetical protein